MDHDELRHDPVLGAVLERLESRRQGCAPLAGKSTLNRLEHAPEGGHCYRRIDHDAAAIEALFVDLFLDAHEGAHLVLDATDDPLHGRQEGRFFHGYYDCYVSDASGPPSGGPRDLRLRYVGEDVGEFLHGAHCGDCPLD